MEVLLHEAEFAVLAETLETRDHFPVRERLGGSGGADDGGFL